MIKVSRTAEYYSAREIWGKRLILGRSFSRNKLLLHPEEQTIHITGKITCSSGCGSSLFYYKGDKIFSGINL